MPMSPMGSDGCSVVRRTPAALPVSLGFFRAAGWTISSRILTQPLNWFNGTFELRKFDRGLGASELANLPYSQYRVICKKNCTAKDKHHRYSPMDARSNAFEAQLLVIGKALSAPTICLGSAGNDITIIGHYFNKP